MSTSDIDTVASIDAVPNILEVACHVTGLGFAAVARVTEDRWTALAVRDNISFGLKPGGELPIKSTICDEIRQSGEAVVIDHVDTDPCFRDHRTPQEYGFQSYISVPIVLRTGEFYGTLCAIDPRPAKVSDPHILKTFELFAELLALHLENRQRAAASNIALVDERRTAEMRDQFIAILGHDLRNPLAALGAGTRYLEKVKLDEKGRLIVGLMQQSYRRMTELTNDILDFARGKLGGGVPLRLASDNDLETSLTHVIDELRAVHPERAVTVSWNIAGAAYCDSARLAQLLSNLVGNALTHGDPRDPVEVAIEGGDDKLQIVVSNSGDHIPETALAGLFHPFASGSSGRTAGVGLGLYIAAEIAKAHGGTLNAVSGNGRITFTAVMPCRKSQEMAA